MKGMERYLKLTKQFIVKYNVNSFFIIILFKVVLLGLFSSGYQSYLFYPFTNWFVEHGDNPWSAIDEGFIIAEFPYSGVMLYVLAPFNFIINSIDSTNFFIRNLIYSIPLIVSDILILFCIVSLAQDNKLKVAYLYFFSPVILFSTYIHNQLDVIPIALLLVSIVFLISRRYKYSALFFGFSISAKLSVILAMPIMVIYIIKKRRWKESFIFVLISSTVFLVSTLPYIYSKSYINNVIFNSKQKMLFDSFFMIGDVELYLPLFFSLILYACFFSFKKSNKDLLISFISLLFITNVFFVVPSPGWYVWLIPFLILSIVKNIKNSNVGYILLFFLNSLYCMYFIVSYTYDYVPVIFLGEEFNLNFSQNVVFDNILFTLLEACLICIGLYLYKFSVKSNNLYKITSPFIIGVGGDSGTGKTTLNTLIFDLFKDKLLQIEGDGDHRWERGNENWNSYTHLNPKANWLHRQSDNLEELKNWKDSRRVDYDHSTGRFTSQYLIKPKKYILISGLHPFYLPISRKLVDLKIYMEPSEELRRYWKIQRDVVHRGYSLEKVSAQIEARISDAEKYIFPQKAFSDLIISFFPNDMIESNVMGHSLNIGLKVICEASISFEPILMDLGVNCSWDYSEDLKSQIVTLFSSPDNVDFEEIAIKCIPNIDELITRSKFKKGYNGFLQLLILLSISQKMRGN